MLVVFLMETVDGDADFTKLQMVTDTVNAFFSLLRPIEAFKEPAKACLDA